MKFTLKKLMLGFCLAGLLAMPAAAQSKVGTIDVRKVFDNYWKRDQADAAIKERRDEFEKEGKALVDGFKKSQEDYNKLVASANDQSVTPEERDKRRATAEAKLLEVKTGDNTLRQFDTNASDTLSTQRKRMIEAILADIKAAVEAKAKAAGYSLVIDVSAKTAGEDTTVVLYSDGANDLTKAVLDQLNATAPVKSDSTKTPDPIKK